MMYVDTPPTKLQQGCIVEAVFFEALARNPEGEAPVDFPAVVMSPACDFEHEKTDFATCIALFPFEQQLEKFKAGSWKNNAESNGQPITTPNTKQMTALAKRVRELVKGAYPRYHWFDALPVGSGGPWVADFQLIASIPREDFEGLKIVAALKPQFMEQLPARWVSYAGRIGTPDRSNEDFNEIEKLAHRLFFDTPAPVETG